MSSEQGGGNLHWCLLITLESQYSILMMAAEHMLYLTSVGESKIPSLAGVCVQEWKCSGLKLAIKAARLFRVFCHKADF